MSVISTMIYDRSLEDVLRIKSLAEAANTRGLTDAEIAEWNAAVVRGAYNAEDINRVGNAAIYTNTYLSGIQPEIDSHRIAHGVADDEIFDAHISDPTEINPRTDFARDTSPVALSEAQKSIDAAKAVAARVGITVTADIAKMTYSAANAVERAIYDAYKYGVTEKTKRKDMVDRIAAAWSFSGDLFCGEIT